MYAILKSGSRQFRVQAGQMIDVDRLDAEEGSTLELGEVLAISNDLGELTVGTPFVEGARIKAKVMRHHKGEKILVLKYKPKVRYRKKTGHRQLFTRVRIAEIAGA